MSDSVYNSNLISSVVNSSFGNNTLIIAGNLNQTVANNDAIVFQTTAVNLNGLPLCLSKVNNSIKVLIAGIYKIQASLTIQNTPANDAYAINVLKNDTIIETVYPSPQTDIQPFLTCVVNTTRQLLVNDVLTVTVSIPTLNATIIGSALYAPYLSLTKIA